MIRLSALPLLIGGLLACGTETGNPEALTFEYNARSSDPARVGLGTDEGATRVDTVWLRLDDVDFRDCDGQVRGTLTGIGFADHGGEEAALQSLELPDVPYCSVETRLFADPGATDEPATVLGASLGVTGTLPDGRDFRVVLDAPIDLEIPLDGARVDGTAWLLTFDVAAWLDTDALLQQVDDPVVVDAATRPQLASELAAAVPGGVHLWRDLDVNGRLDDGEPAVE